MSDSLSVIPTPPTWIFSVCSLISFCLVCIPLPWQLYACNTGPCLYIIWTSLACLNAFINSIIWKDNAINWAPVWCNISSYLIIGTSIALPAASLCINRRLYAISLLQRATITKSERRWAVIIDLSIGVGIPVFAMVLQYFCAGHQFNIYEEIGCWPATYNTPLAFLLVYSLPIIIGCISGVYCCLSIRRLAAKRSELKQIFCNNLNLSTSYYLRLMCLAGIEIMFTVPLGCFSLYLNATVSGGIAPYLGWADTHYNYSYVGQYASVQWKTSQNSVIAFMLTRWSLIFCAVAFFGFFGFAEEALRNYRLALCFLAQKFRNARGRRYLGRSSSLTSPQKLPSRRRSADPVDSSQQMTSLQEFDPYANVKLTLDDVSGEYDNIKEHICPRKITMNSSSSFGTGEGRTSLTLEPSIQRPEPVLNITPMSHQTTNQCYRCGVV